MSDLVLYVSDNDFEKTVINASGPVLVDFWAEWCGPCKMIAPVLDEIAKDYEGKLTVAKLNIDESPATTSQYGIRSIPTLMLFINGEVEGTKMGAQTKSQLSAFINNYLK